MKKAAPTLLFILFLTTLHSQTHKIDSLLGIIKKGVKDSSYVLALNRLSIEYASIGDFKEAMSRGKEAQVLARSLNNKQGLATSYNVIGNAYLQQGYYTEAMENYRALLKLSKELGDKKRIADSYNNFGTIYFSQNNYAEALTNYFQALKIRMEMKDKAGSAATSNNLGLVYFRLNKFDDALKNFSSSIKINEELGNYRSIGSTYGNMGAVYYQKGDYDKALASFLASLKIALETKNKKTAAGAYCNIGSVYISQKNYPEAIKSTMAGLAIAEETGDNDRKSLAELNLGLSNLKMRKYPEAKKWLDQALVHSKLLGSKQNLDECYSHYSEIDSAQGNFKQAFADYKYYTLYKDSIFNEENTQKAIRSEMNFEFEKKQTADSVRNAEAQKLKDAQIKAQTILLRQEQTQRYALIGGLCLIALFSGFIFNRFKVTQKQKKIIEEQKSVVEQQKQTVEFQKELVEVKNREITDSITYAKRLQQAILPPEKEILKAFPESFLLYKPKDIVAGDFYWMERSGSRIFIAAADCTGHGVPGAMVSVVCSNALNRAVKEFGKTSPGEILDKVRELVIETFEKSESDVKDGMDISIACLDTKNNTVQWAGANNPLWYIHEKNLLEIKPDKQAIGKSEVLSPFQTHTVPVSKGDILFLLTDGYADQFGGPKGKKLKYKFLQKIILEHSGKSLPEIKEQLERAFDDWKGSLEQVDDVCIIGIRC